MTPDERTALEAELIALKRKYDKCVDEPGFAATALDVMARIAEIEALLVE